MRLLSLERETRSLRKDCPRLGPFAENGRQTRTRAILVGRPVIDRGHADAGVTEDQRGANRHVRGVDIGSVERRDGEIDDRLFASTFEPVCEI